MATMTMSAECNHHRSVVVPSFAWPLSSARSRASGRRRQLALNGAAGRGGGMGMGGTVATPTKTKKRSGGMGNGMGKVKNGGKKKKSPPFDVAASLVRSEKLYEEICTEAAKALNDETTEYWNDGDLINSEYMVAARCKGGSGTTAAVSDWVPVAQLCVARPYSDDANGHQQAGGGDDDEDRIKDLRIQAAVSYYRRELCHAATRGSSVFNSIPRNDIQYSVEPTTSFHKFVYEDVVEGKNDDANNDNVMSKVEARVVLQLEEGCADMATIKASYRKLSFALHPDRFVGVDRTEEEIREASRKFGRVKLAYETLSSGIRTTAGRTNGEGVAGLGGGRSWYESLGGRARTEFSGPIDLLPMEVARETVLGGKFKCAVAAVERDVVMTFVTRNQAAGL